MTTDPLLEEISAPMHRWSDLAYALERAGIATPEQRERLLDEFQQAADREWKAQLASIKADHERRAARPWWKKVLLP